MSSKQVIIFVQINHLFQNTYNINKKKQNTIYMNISRQSLSSSIIGSFHSAYQPKSQRTTYQLFYQSILPPFPQNNSPSNPTHINQTTWNLVVNIESNPPPSYISITFTSNTESTYVQRPNNDTRNIIKNPNFQNAELTNIFQSQIHQMKVENESLKKDNNHLAKRYSNIEHELKEMKKILQSYNNRITHSNSIILTLQKNLNNEKQDHKNTKCNLQQQIKLQQAKFLQIKRKDHSQIFNMDMINNKLKNQKDKIQKYSKSLQEQLERVNTQKNELFAKVKQKQNQINTQKDEKKTLLINIDNLKILLQFNKKQISSIKQSYEAQKDKNIQLNQRLILNNKEHEQSIRKLQLQEAKTNSLQTQNEEFSKKTDALLRQNQELTQRIQEIELQIDTIRESEKTLKQIQHSTFIKLQKQTEQHQNLINQITIQGKQIKHQLCEIISQKEEKEKQLESSNTIISQLLAEREHLHSQIQELNFRIELQSSIFAQEVSQISKKNEKILQTYKSKIEILESEKDYQLKKNMELQQAVKDYNELLENKQQISAQLKDLRSVNEKLQQQNFQKQLKIQQQINDLQIMAADLNHIKSQSSAQKAKFFQLLHQYQQEKQITDNTINNLKEEIQQLQEDYNQQKADLQQQKNNLTLNLQDNKLKIQELENKCQSLEKQMILQTQNKRSEIEYAKKNEQELKLEKQQLIKQLIALTTTLNNIKSTSDQKIKQLETQIENLKDSFDKKHQQLQNIKLKCEKQLQEKINIQQSIIINNNKSIKQMQHQLQQYQESIQSHKFSTLSLKKQFDNLSQKLKEQNLYYQNIIQHSNNHLYAAENQITQKKQQNNLLKAQLKIRIKFLEEQVAIRTNIIQTKSQQILIQRQKNKQIEEILNNKICENIKLSKQIKDKENQIQKIQHQNALLIILTKENLQKHKQQRNKLKKYENQIYELNHQIEVLNQTLEETNKMNLSMQLREREELLKIVSQENLNLRYK